MKTRQQTSDVTYCHSVGVSRSAELIIVTSLCMQACACTCTNYPATMMGAATARIASCVSSSRAAATFSSIATFPSTRLLMLTSQPCHVAAKTRTASFSSLSLIRTKPLTTSVNCSPKVSHSCQHNRTTENTKIRWFASGSHDEQPNTPSTGADREETAPSTISGSSQHDTWVEFQRSISVSGVDTGQIVKERTLGKKNRGGNIARKRKEREAEMVAQLKGVDNVIQVRGGPT